MKNQEIIRQVKNVARDRFAFPGGYVINVVMADGELCCAQCARENFGLIGRATRDHDHSGWRAAGTEIYWGGPDEYCANCNKPIVSEYGDPNEEG